MRRLALTLCLVAVAGALAAGPAMASTAPRSKLTGFACHSTLDPAQRSVSVVSVMRPVPGTRTLSVKLDLLEQLPGAVAGSVGDVGDLGRWLTPADATLGRRAKDVWKLAKTVYDVDAPAHYQFEVDFRWLGAHGKVLATAVQQTGRCAERELRPDVLVRSVVVSALPLHPHRERYVAVIANGGATATGPFSVLFNPGDGITPRTRAVASLAPHASRRVSFLGPICDAASPPTVVADPGDQVDDLNRANNTLSVACPAPGAPSATD